MHPLHCATYVRWWYEFVASFTDLSHLYYLIASTVLICRVDSKQSWALHCNVCTRTGRPERSQHSANTTHCSVHLGLISAKLDSQALPTLCLLMLHTITTHDEISLVVLLCICVLKAIKYWKWGRPGNETKELVHIATSYIYYMCVSSICWCSVGNDECALYSGVCW